MKSESSRAMFELWPSVLDLRPSERFEEKYMLCALELPREKKKKKREYSHCSCVQIQKSP